MRKVSKVLEEPREFEVLRTWGGLDRDGGQGVLEVVQEHQESFQVNVDLPLGQVARAKADVDVRELGEPHSDEGLEQVEGGVDREVGEGGVPAL